MSHRRRNVQLLSAALFVQALVLPAPALAGYPTEITVSARTFQVSEDEPFLEQAMREVKSATSREQRLRIAQAEARVLLPSLLAQNPQASDPAALASRYSELLPKHFEQTLAKHAHESIRADGRTTYRIPDGIAFWVDFLTPEDPELASFARAFIEQDNRQRATDYAYRLVASLGGEVDGLSQVLRTRNFSRREWVALAKLASSRGLSLAMFDGYALVGSGLSFHLTHGVLREAEALKDPALGKSSERLLRFLSKEGIHIAQGDAKGATAFYDPTENLIAFVMPGQAELDPFFHETTHGRFKKFLGTLKRWGASKGYALPYELDGPSMRNSDFGGYMNLLNEVNSWRAGSPFEQRLSDKEILKILSDHYGRQAGIESARTFATFWTPKRLRGKSVPRLIFQHVRALNSLDDRELVRLGQRAIRERNLVQQHNFLRILGVRYAEKAPPPEMLRVVSRMTLRPLNPEIEEMARVTLATYAGNASPPDKPSAAAEEIARKAAEWLRSLERPGVLVPGALAQDPTLIGFAVENGIESIDAAVAEANRRSGGAHFIVSPEERELFEKIRGAPGADLRQKAGAYLTEFTHMPFEQAWREFSRRPTPELTRIIHEKHLPSLSSARIRELVQWTLHPEVDANRFQHAGHLLDLLFTGKDEAARRALLDPEIDRLLADTLFKEGGGTAKSALINLIIGNTSPGELPRLQARLLETIAESYPTDTEINRARSFIIPMHEFQRGSAPWGAATVDAIWKVKNPSASELEMVAEYYRLVVGRHEWGKRAGSLLDASAREAGMKVIEARGPEIREAADRLWRMLSSRSARVRLAATYAIASSPPFFLELEPRLAEAMPKANAPQRKAAVQLLGMTEPGFSPRLERALAAAGPFTRVEHGYLSLRLSPAQCIRDYLRSP